MSQHTPAPWTYGPDMRGRMRVFAGRHEIARALSEHGDRRLPPAEREANARLIAEAPEMAALLAEAADVIAEHKRRLGIVTIGMGTCIERRIRHALQRIKLRQPTELQDVERAQAEAR
jgi:hypothetical protein